MPLHYSTLPYVTLPYITLDYITLHTYTYIHICIYIYTYFYTEIRFNYWAQHNFLFVCARLLIFKHHFLLRSCCYDLGFRTLLLLTFQHSSLYCLCCCSALGFQIWLPTTFLLLYSWLSNTTTCSLLLRSRLSNITSYYVLAATLWGFQHNFRLRFCCEALVFPPQTRPIMFVAAMLLTFSHYFLLIVALLLTVNHPFYYVLAATLLAFQHNFPFVVPSLLAFKYYFLVRSCCYALGFPTWLPTTFLLLRCWLSNITSDYVSAAALLAFHHAPVLLIAYPYVVATLLDFQLNFHLCLLLPRSSLSNMTSYFGSSIWVRTDLNMCH